MGERNPYYRGPATYNFDGTRFFNPGEANEARGPLEALKWKGRGTSVPWPRRLPGGRAVPEERVAGLRVTMVGHATLLVQAAGLNVLTDPIWSERASPVAFAGPRRVSPPGVRFDDLPPIDAVLLSHNHYDHFDLATLRRLQERFAPTVVTPLGNDAILAPALPGARILAGDWGDAFDLGKGATAHVVPANHWSSRGLRDRRMALWGGFMLRTGAGLVYFAGDTGYGTAGIFRAMRERYGRPDAALLPIGSYAPEWFMAPQHASPEDAVRILLDVEPRLAIGIHWRTFKMTDEAVDEPPKRLAAALAAERIEPARFRAALPGDVFDVD